MASATASVNSFAICQCLAKMALESFSAADTGSATRTTVRSVWIRMGTSQCNKKRGALRGLDLYHFAPEKTRVITAGGFEVDRIRFLLRRTLWHHSACRGASSA